MSEPYPSKERGGGGGGKGGHLRSCDRQQEGAPEETPRGDLSFGPAEVEDCLREGIYGNGGKI